MSQIRNVAAEVAIEKAVNLVHGCKCISISAQSNYYNVVVSEMGGTRCIKVDNAAHAMRILNRQEPE